MAQVDPVRHHETLLHAALGEPAALHHGSNFPPNLIVALQISEARALRWSDLDLAAGSVVVKGTKTERAYRRLNLSHWLAERLRARADRQGTEGLVFASPALADPEARWEQSNRANALAAVIRAAGYPWATPHTFRHTLASLLHEQGVPMARIADWLGHRDIAVTARYLGRDLGSDKADLAGLL